MSAVRTPPPMATPVPAFCPSCGHLRHEGGTCLYAVEQVVDQQGEQTVTLTAPCQCHVPARVESWWGARDAIAALDRKIDALTERMDKRLNRQALDMRRLVAAVERLGCAACPAGGGGIEDDEDRPSEPGNGG